MIDFLQHLKQRYTSILETAMLDAEQQTEMRARLNALRLAESVLRKLSINHQHPEHTLQIGILGPTQAGKSTLVNLLLQHREAGVSPLAGFTVHAQGFASAVKLNELEFLKTIFHDFDQVETRTLDPDNYRQFSLESTGHLNIPEFDSCVLWDSPDFDSIESRGYRASVLRVAAVSDVLILMLSKDKYADRSVWDMLEMLSPLNKPMMVCINKLNPEDRNIVIESFNKRYRAASTNHSQAITTPTIVTLPYSRGLDETGSQFDSGVKLELESALGHLIQQVDRERQQIGAKALLEQHWQNWLEPVRQEHEAQTRWHEIVDEVIKAGLQEYRENYLDHPQKYDTLNKAIAELLTLLEIPGLAAPLLATRKVVTWPMRKLLGIGQALVGDDKHSAAQRTDIEEEALARVLEHMLSKLGNTSLDMSEAQPTQHYWWLALNKKLRKQSTALQGEFSQCVENYQRDFEPEIENAAKNLYENLQQQPTVLNGLRAARVSADAAAVVLAVKSGGLAASDLVLAPAILSVTSMLTEGAIGKYMDTVKTDLKQRQLSTVESDVMERVLRQRLVTTAQALDSNNLFMIKPEEIERAEQQLGNWDRHDIGQRVTGRHS